VPVHNDRRIYEFLVLEVFQAGLSWRTVLYKRKNFRNAFAGFDYRKVARFGRRDVAHLLKDAGIIRNRMKIEAAINNAQRLLDVRREFGTFSAYMWSWVGGKPIVHRFRTLKDYPPYIEEAVAWAKDLKQRGFKFLGPTVVYLPAGRQASTCRRWGWSMTTRSIASGARRVGTVNRTSPGRVVLPEKDSTSSDPGSWQRSRGAPGTIPA